VIGLSLPRLEDYVEWRALREGSRKILAAVEPGWDDSRLSMEFFAEYVERLAEAAKEGRGYSMLVRNSAGVLVGGAALGPIRDGAGLLGTWIGAPFVGRGYAVRAVAAMLDIAFGFLNLRAVGATVLVDNDPSIRILEHFGFEHDPARNIVLSVNGEPRLHLIYKVDRHGREHSPAEQSKNRIQRQAAA
jgi:ribosomal-protein-alanine N-acetyltransferase